MMGSKLNVILEDGGNVRGLIAGSRSLGDIHTWRVYLISATFLLLPAIS
jgi:hypothetical protein